MKVVVVMPSYNEADNIGKTNHGGAVYYEHLAFMENIRTNTHPLTDARTGWWCTAVGCWHLEEAC